MERRRIGILNSGGDCPGLNAVLRGAVRAAQKLGWEVVGFKDGFEGLLPPGRFIMLDRHKTAGIMPLGGTILGTTNKGHFVAKVGAQGTKAVIAEEIIEQARAVLKGLRVEGLIVIGGDGSLTTALQLHEAGIPTVGVPKTIDNDLAATAMTFGFDSAVACVADALDRLHTTASSHRRVMVIEVMGRHAGWIALYGGLAGGGGYHPAAGDSFRLREDRRNSAEADRGRLPLDDDRGCGRSAAQGRRDPGHGPRTPANTAWAASRKWWPRKSRRGRTAEVRVCVLGHLQRGGAPTTLDRILGTRFGIHAVEMIAAGKYGLHGFLSELPGHGGADRRRREPPAAGIAGRPDGADRARGGY